MSDKFVLITQFSTLMETFKTILPSMTNDEEKKLAEAWLAKIKPYNTSLDVLLQRHRLMSCLIEAMTSNKLTPPFDNPPKFTNIKNVRIPKQCANMGALPVNRKLPKIMSQSPDQGAFLVNQPVPKCGAFCYLAVVSRPPN